jgi:hypothetical protein
MREVILDENCITYSVRPELESQVCIDKHAADLVHDGDVESLSQSIWAFSLGNLMTDSLLT